MERCVERYVLKWMIRWCDGVMVWVASRVVCSGVGGCVVGWVGSEQTVEQGGGGMDDGVV